MSQQSTNAGLAIVASALAVAAVAAAGPGAYAAAPLQTVPPDHGEASPTGGPDAAAAEIRLGVDVVAAGDGGPLRGRRVGLITNHTGRDSAGNSTIDVLHDHPAIELAALFGPEHGLRGSAGAGDAVADGRDPKTGLPIHSLYGETRRPTAAMLEGLDALAFDIQDVGARYYTYVWTMALAMRSAAEHGLRFVVLDRPNPIGGDLVQGNVLDPEYSTFVGLYPVPMRHGMTAGELARLLNAEHDIGAELAIVELDGWARDAWYDDTAAQWIAPSPNMPSLESATHYPGTCLFEGTNLSVGRGTPRAFQQIGAPWLDHEELVRRLRRRELPGVELAAVAFTPREPGDGKYGGERVSGVRFTATDRSRYDPTVAAVAALVEIQRMHPDSLAWHESHFDRLAGTGRLRAEVAAGASVERITRPWSAQLQRFRDVRQGYLLY